MMNIISGMILFRLNFIYVIELCMQIYAGVIIIANGITIISICLAMFQFCLQFKYEVGQYGVMGLR